MPTPTTFTAKEIAKKLGVSERTIRLWSDAGRMPPPHKPKPGTHHHNVRFVWNRREINAWIKENFEIVEYEY